MSDESARTDAHDSDLTRRAREVLAGLTAAQRRDLADTCARGSFWRSRTGHVLERKGLTWGSGLRDRAYRPTDLGREVARLLSEEVDRG